MSLLVSNNLNAAAYLQLGNFQLTTRTRQIIRNGQIAGLNACYVDKFDRCLGHVHSVEDSGERPIRWDPNLIDATSSSVGLFDSPLNNGNNTPWFVSDYDPSTTGQRLFHAQAQQSFNELNIADPTVIIDTDPFPKINRGESFDFDFSANEEFAWAAQSGTNPNVVFFPGMDLAIAANIRVIVGTTPGVTKFNIIGFITLSTGACVPSGIPGIYSNTADEFGRPAIFDETSVHFLGVQFLADDQSTSAQPKGELLFFSLVTAPVTPNDGRCYIKFVDFNPFAVAGTPNRVHLRETLFSRVNLTLNTLPTGSPPSPLNGLDEAVGSLQAPNVWFTTEGSKRLNIMASNSVGVGEGDTNVVQATQAVVASILTVPAPKNDALTNKTIGYRAEVLGDLGELVANAIVDWSMLRLSTVSEVLATTPIAGETVVVANFPINRTIEFPAGFAVMEDGIPLTETTHYTVNESLGQIIFVAPKPLGGGEVYTARYCHTADPATPPHSSIIDAQVFSDINGIAETRVTVPDDAALVGHLDQIKAETPT